MFHGGHGGGGHGGGHGHGGHMGRPGGVYGGYYGAALPVVYDDIEAVDTVAVVDTPEGAVSVVGSPVVRVVRRGSPYGLLG